jgi:hypothetical protein
MGRRPLRYSVVFRMASLAGAPRVVPVRMPIRSETEAVRFVFAGAAVITVSVLLGFLTTALVGVVVFALALLVGAIAYLRADNPDQTTPLRDAQHDPHPHGPPAGTRRVLVVANEALEGDDLCKRITAADDRPVEVDVLVPVLTSHMHYTMSDIDSESVEAQRRLERSLVWAKNHGIQARGEVGDPNPTAALEDQLRDFGADEVIVVTHPRDRETWQEHGELERLRRELDVPVAHLVIGQGDAITPPRT